MTTIKTRRDPNAKSRFLPSAEGIDFFCPANGLPMSVTGISRGYLIRRKAMKLNQSVYYAIACLIELSYRTGEYVDADHIATSQNIPPAYKHKVLQALSQVGLVFSLKGNGY